MPGCQPRSSGSVAAHGLERHIDVGRLKQFEMRRHDADDRVGRLSSCRTCPTGSCPANRRAANASLRITTALRPRDRRRRRSPRPFSIETPSSGSRDAVIIFAGTRSGSPNPATVMLVGRKAAMAGKRFRPGPPVFVVVNRRRDRRNLRRLLVEQHDLLGMDIRAAVTAEPHSRR